MKRSFVLASAALASLGLLLPAQATPPAGTPDASDHRASPPGGATRAEPSVAVDPRNPKVVVTATRDYGTAGIGVYHSADGGHRWSASELPVLAGARYGGDPNLAFDGGGRVFAAYISYTSAPDGVGGLTVARSLDGGRHWGRTASLPKRNTRSSFGCTFADYPAIAVDTRHGHDVVYVVWQDISYTGTDCSTFRSRTLLLVTSGDHGRTWSRPRAVGGTHDGFLPRMTVGPDGAVYVTYAYEPPTLPISEQLGCAASSWAVISRVARSTDGGRTFRVADAQRTCAPSSAVWVGDPVVGAQLASYTGATYRLPASTSTAVDRRTGVLVNVLGGQGEDTVQQVSTAWSRDGGRTWHPGGAISGLAAENQQFPWVTSGPDGHLAVVYLGQLPGGFFVAEHATSVDDGRSWSPAVRLASVPSHVHSGYLAGWIGDYLGDAIGSDGLAHPVWTDLRELAVQQSPVDPYMGGPFDGGTVYTRSVRD